MRNLNLRWNRLAVKLPMIAMVSAFVASAAVAISSHMAASGALMRSEQQTMEALARFRAKAVESFAGQLAFDLNELAENPSVRMAFDSLNSAYRMTDGAVVKAHARGGEKRADERAQEDRSVYGVAHRRWHPELAQLGHGKPFADILLIAGDGEVIHSLAKADDFAANLRGGHWRDAGLARAFEAAMKNGAGGRAAFSDFGPHGPPDSQMAAFLARTLPGPGGAVSGVVAVRIAPAAVAAALGDAYGLTGHAYVVGADGRLRTQTARRGAQNPLAAAPKNDVVAQALAGRASAGFGSALGGQPAVIAAAPAKFFGLDWAVASEILKSEISAPIDAMFIRNGMVAMGFVAAVSLMALWMARGMTGALTRMTDAVEQIAAGEQAAIPCEDRRDELGQLARSLRLVHEAGVTAAQIKAGLDNAGVNVTIADAQGRVIYVNKAMRAFLASHGRAFADHFPGVDPADLIGAPAEPFLRELEPAPDGASRGRIDMDGLTVELTASPILDGAGGAIGVIAEWRNLTDDLKAMAEVAEVVSAATRGDFSARIDASGKTGLIGQLASGQNEINTLVEAAMGEFTKALGALAEGDLMVRASDDFGGLFAQMAEGINTTVSRLSDTVATIQRSARDINAAATEINAGATDLAKRTEEEAASLEETAATTEQLAASVKQTADASRKASKLSDKARLAATEGGMVVNEAINAIIRIEEASRKISEIIGVIDDIAFQTNLLALNAAVEAARAGEAGRGFAVVASEVRTLAQRSGQAARDIKELIVGSAEQVTEGVKLVKATGEALQNIVSASTEVADTVVHISSASAEQANGIDEMSAAVARIDEMTQQNSALAEQSAASATELMSQIDRLNRLVSAFRIDRKADRMAERPGSRAPSRPAAARQESAQAPLSEPDRLRRMAADAFAQSRAARPARTAAAGGRGALDDWAEF